MDQRNARALTRPRGNPNVIIVATWALIFLIGAAAIGAVAAIAMWLA